MEEDFKKVNLIELLRTFKKEGLDNFVVIRKENFKKFIPISVIQNKILNPMKEEYDKAIDDFMKKEIPECMAGGEVAQALGCFIGKIEELLDLKE